MIDKKIKEVIFYHITSTTTEKPLANLAHKLYEKKERTLILCNDEEEMQSINKYLWSFSTKKFIPHGSIEDSYTDQQPILISTNTKNLANNPSVLVLSKPINISNLPSAFSKYIYIFSGNESDTEVMAMNAVYENCLAQKEYSVKYWILDADGKWLSR